MFTDLSIWNLQSFELIIYQEEQIFRKSLAFSAGLKYPVPPEAVDDQED